MRVFGIDPGSLITPALVWWRRSGWPAAPSPGALYAPAQTNRYRCAYNASMMASSEALRQWEPEAVAVERVFSLITPRLPSFSAMPVAWRC